MAYQNLVISLITLISFTFVYFYALYIKNNSIIDSFWGIGFIITAVSSVAVSQYFSITQVIVTTLVIIWGTRLSVRIHKRNKGKPEDFRYAKWRQDWGKLAGIKSYTNVFLLQGIICIIISIPVIIVNTHASSVNLPILLTLGFLIWIVGFLFETISDAQLDSFKNSKPEKDLVLDKGLWKYSRHPNYFGESLQWWGIAIIAISTNSSMWWLFISPILITYLLLYVSGVPLLEKKMSQNPKYKDYIKKTNKFIPGLTKS